jgi:hypothetical protein
MNETEPCELWSIDPPMKIGDGHIGIGCMGLPVLLYADGPRGVQEYHPWSLPANFRVRPLNSNRTPGELLHAWHDIEKIMRRLSDWSRRHDDCGRETQNKDRRLWIT